MSQVQYSVVILYQHALLGEGIAKLLHAQLGVEAMIALGDNPEAVTSALARGPAVVIFEMGDTLRQFDLTTLAPQAILIDVSTVVTRGPVVSSGVAGMERILQAVRSCMKVDEPTETWPVLAEQHDEWAEGRLPRPRCPIPKPTFPDHQYQQGGTHPAGAISA